MFTGVRAPGTCESQQTLALVVVLLVDARGVVLARPGRALVDVNLARVPLEAGHAEAVELCHPVHANGSVLAGLRRALVHVVRARLALESRRAAALEALRLQMAGGVVAARPVRAVGHACPALASAVSLGAPAEIAVGSVHAQGTGCAAGVARALVHFLGAVVAREAVRADAGVLRRARGAGAVLARRERAGVVELVAVFPHVPDALGGTEARVVVHGVHAGRAVAAGRGQALLRRGCAKYSFKQRSRLEWDKQNARDDV